MVSDEEKDKIAEELERLYSLINRRRFYELLGELEAERVRVLQQEAMEIAAKLKLSDKEVEEMADEMDDYNITGVSKRGEVAPLDYWVDVIATRLNKK
ncbi:MAG TPA: hypothetical protein EYH45_06100 [Candidatus Caldiarchaeum subterraneum]|uniref:Uncharacterized protein n=1 Tax=Caldiarchaeum subterraneum TaxID=311458 RepID=A0A832ZWD6_CALS0|nr:hypothetical protein [Candidatus Caldarchaeum subterraneum]